MSKTTGKTPGSSRSIRHHPGPSRWHYGSTPGTPRFTPVHVPGWTGEYREPSGTGALASYNGFLYILDRSKRFTCHPLPDLLILTTTRIIWEAFSQTIITASLYSTCIPRNVPSIHHYKPASLLVIMFLLVSHINLNAAWKSAITRDLASQMSDRHFVILNQSINSLFQNSVNAIQT